MGRLNLMAVAAIFLAALTSTEVEACLGEPCNIGNPTMCRLIRETNQADAMPPHRSLCEPMPARRRLPANWQVEQNRREKEMLAAKRRTRKSKKRGIVGEEEVTLRPTPLSV